jgi:hypothetical protein
MGPNHRTHTTLIGEQNAFIATRGPRPRLCPRLLSSAARTNAVSCNAAGHSNRLSGVGLTHTPHDLGASAYGAGGYEGILQPETWMIWRAA